MGEKQTMVTVFLHPGGMSAISRGLSEATPPESAAIAAAPRSACQQTWTVRWFAARWHPFRMLYFGGHEPGVSLADSLNPRLIDGNLPGCSDATTRRRSLLPWP